MTLIARAAIALALLLITSAAVEAAAPAREVTVAIERGDDSGAELAARHLGDRLEVPPRIETTTKGVELPALLEQARGPWSSRFVVLLSPERGQVSVIRSEDGTALTRFLERTAIQQSPFALAVAAAELLELARRPRTDPEAPVMAPVIPAELSLLLAAGAGASSGPSGLGVSFTPSLAAALIYRSEGREAWGSIELRGHFAARGTASLSLPAEALTARYLRHELELASSIGLSRGALDLGLAATFSVSLARVAIDGAAEEIEDRQAVPWIGAGGIVRYHFRPLGVALSAQAAVTPRPVRWLVREMVALEEGGVRGQAMLAVFWER